MGILKPAWLLLSCGFSYDLMPLSYVFQLQWEAPIDV